MFDSVPQGSTGHPGGILIQEAQQLEAIIPACFPQPAADCLMDQILVVVEQHFCNCECIGEIALPDKETGADNGETGS